MNVIACGLTSQERLQYSGRPYLTCLYTRVNDAVIYPCRNNLFVQVLKVNQHRMNHLACNHSRQQLSLIHRRPKAMYSLPARYAHVKRPNRVKLPVLNPTNAPLLRVDPVHLS